MIGRLSLNVGVSSPVSLLHSVCSRAQFFTCSTRERAALPAPMHRATSSRTRPFSTASASESTLMSRAAHQCHQARLVVTVHVDRADQVGARRQGELHIAG